MFRIRIHQQVPQVVTLELTWNIPPEAHQAVMDTRLNISLIGEMENSQAGAVQRRVIHILILEITLCVHAQDVNRIIILFQVGLIVNQLPYQMVRRQCQ